MPPSKPDLRRGPRRSTKKALSLYYAPTKIAAFCKACHADGETMTEVIEAVMDERIAIFQRAQARKRAAKAPATKPAAPKKKRVPASA